MTYGFDRKSKHFWLRIFFIDYNAHYSSMTVGCMELGLRPDLLVFHLEFVHKLLEQVGSWKGVRPGTGKKRVDMVN